MLSVPVLSFRSNHLDVDAKGITLRQNVGPHPPRPGAGHDYMLADLQARGGETTKRLGCQAAATGRPRGSLVCIGAQYRLSDSSNPTLGRCASRWLRQLGQSGDGARGIAVWYSIVYAESCIVFI